MTFEYILMWSIGHSLINGWDQSRKLSKSKFDQSGNLTKIWARGSSTPTGSICLEKFRKFSNYLAMDIWNVNTTYQIKNINMI